jgi:hypothetical protein
MRKPHAEMTVPGLGKMNYGYATMIQNYPNDFRSFGHNGGTPGYGAELQHYSNNRDDFTLIIISNYDRRVRGLMLKAQAEILKETGKTASEQNVSESIRVSKSS